MFIFDLNFQSCALNIFFYCFFLPFRKRHHLLCHFMVHVRLSNKYSSSRSHSHSFSITLFRLSPFRFCFNLYIAFNINFEDTRSVIANSQEQRTIINLQFGESNRNVSFLEIVRDIHLFHLLESIYRWFNGKRVSPSSLLLNEKCQHFYKWKWKMFACRIFKFQVEQFAHHHDSERKC